MAKGRRAKQSKSRRVAVGIAVALIAIAAGGVLFLTLRLTNAGRGGLELDANASIGTAGEDREEVIARLQAEVDASMLTMSINATPVLSLSDPDSGVNWQIENPEGQGKLIQVTVYRDDTGEAIYETGALAPGTYVTGTPPDVPLPAGTYSCTAYFRSYSLEDEKYLGQAGTQITLTVLD